MTTAFTAALPRRWPLPAGGCDCHVHIYDLDRHPLHAAVVPALAGEGQISAPGSITFLYRIN